MPIGGGATRRKWSRRWSHTKPGKILHLLLSVLPIGQAEAAARPPEGLHHACHRSPHSGTPPRTGSSHPPETALATRPSRRPRQTGADRWRHRSGAGLLAPCRQELGRPVQPRGPQHEDANPEVQEFFKEIVVEQIDAIAEQHPDQEVRTSFQDEARFGTQGTITRVWAPKGSRPRAVRQNGREWLSVLMAVCVSTGAASALIMPELNPGVLNLFLEQFWREWPAGVHAVLIWDGA